MAVKMGIYKCLKCGNVVEVVVAGDGELVCCGEPMKLMDEKTKEGAGEKHLPVIEPSNGGILVKVGSVPHPMEADHWIQFIEVIRKDGKTGRKDLNPGDKPEVFFDIKPEEVSQVREFCNKHGLWTK
ncbi:MAG: desulfoferrodoxin [Spirochaetia bacterium]|nr:desulfoferrodoxin [Spirochaetia bacterium]